MTLPDVGLPGRTASAGAAHVHREGAPDFSAFRAEPYPLALRRRTARQWWRRAREEYGSIHEFSQLSYGLTAAQAPMSLLATLSRIITDEVRHAMLCSSMARALLPEEEPDYEWEPVHAPWPVSPPVRDGHPENLAAMRRWAMDVVMCACCIGETLSRPLYEALAYQVTDPIAETVLSQILKDEQLHATFGWETLEWLLTFAGPGDVAWLEERVANRFASYELSCVGGRFDRASLEGATVEVTEAGPDSPPNLGLQDPRTYAIIFFDTLASEIIPRFHALGIDGEACWQRRPATFAQS